MAELWAAAACAQARRTRTLMTLSRLLTALLAAASIAAAAPSHAVAQGRGGGGGAPLTLPGAGPAQVPAAVAIARPTAAEIEATQRALARFVESTDAATRATLQKYPDLLAVRAPQPNSAIVPSLAAGFVAKHQANLEVAKQGDANVLFMGDSITDFWRNAEGAYAGKPVLDKLFGQWTVANFGIAGSPATRRRACSTGSRPARAKASARRR
jgi:hypothetical protein